MYARWSAIASHLPGRTDNEIKNFWNTHLKKKLIQMGFDPMTHRPRTDIFSSLPHLIALANLKELVDQHSSLSSSSAWGDHAAKLQTEAVQLARLQYLQFLLQPPMDNNQSALNFLPYSLQSAAAAADDSLSVPFSHLPELQAPCGFQTPPMSSCSKENGEVLNDFSSLMSSQGDLMNSLNSSSPWLPASSSTPPPPLLPEAAGSTTTASFNPGDNCCGSAGGASFWPDVLFDDDPFFQEIA